MRRKIGVLLAILTVLALSNLSVLTGYCKDIVKYQDDIVSFEYDADYICSIDLAEDTDCVRYAITTDMREPNMMGFLKIEVENKKNYEKYKSGWLGSIYPISAIDGVDSTVEVLNEGDKQEIYIEYDSAEVPFRYRKILGDNSKTFIWADYFASFDEESNDFLKAIYDSLKVSDKYLQDQYFYPEEINIVGIYKNVILSDQALEYSSAATSIIEQYLELRTDSKTALRELQEIADRFEKYAKESEYYYDSDAQRKIKAICTWITLGDDKAVIEYSESLKSLCKIE